MPQRQLDLGSVTLATLPRLPLIDSFKPHPHPPPTHTNQTKMEFPLSTNQAKMFFRKQLWLILKPEPKTPISLSSALSQRLN